MKNIPLEQLFAYNFMIAIINETTSIFNISVFTERGNCIEAKKFIKKAFNDIDTSTYTILERESDFVKNSEKLLESWANGSDFHLEPTFSDSAKDFSNNSLKVGDFVIYISSGKYGGTLAKGRFLTCQSGLNFILTESKNIISRRSSEIYKA